MSERRRARETAERIDDETVAVDRVAPDADDTVTVDRAMPESGATLRSEPEEIDEATALVERAGRHPLIEDDTLVAERGGWLPEGTVRVGRGASVQGFAGPLAGLAEAPTARNRFAPPSGGRRAAPGAGAGATSRYTVRRAVAPAPPTETIVQAAEPTRDPAAVLPSVRRRARRGAIVSLVTAGAAVVVAVGGLALVIPMLLAG